MDRKPYQVLVIVAVMALIGLTAGIASAATVTQAITYQGKLTDAAGNPLTGSYTVKFSLYDVETGGTAIVQNSRTVECVNGLFTTPVLFTLPVYDGRALWLGVKVGSDPEMTPRLVIRPVPYALGLRPGAQVSSSGTSPALLLKNTGGGPVLNLSASEADSIGVFAETYGVDSDAFSAFTRSDNSEGFAATTIGNMSDGVSVTTHGNSANGFTARTWGSGSEAVYARTDGLNSDAVYARTYGGSSNGLYARTDGTYSEGVVSVTTGDDSDGVYISTAGLNSRGVYATTTGGESNGITVETLGPGSRGLDISTEGDFASGIESVTLGDYANGLTTRIYGTFSDGLSMETFGNNSDGMEVYTHGLNSEGVFVRADGKGSDGVIVNVNGESGYGISADSNQSTGVYANTGRADHKWGFYTEDYLYAGGTQVPSSDVAEYLPVADDVPPGTVLVIGPDGKLRPSESANDTSVAGIVSTDPGVTLGTREDGNTGEALVAVAGRVPCRVDAGYGAVHAGDLLTTSDTPGYAMKAEMVSAGTLRFYLPGTILGKAMGALESGTGTIEVLVTLQ